MSGKRFIRHAFPIRKAYSQRAPFVQNTPEFRQCFIDILDVENGIHGARLRETAIGIRQGFSRTALDFNAAAVDPSSEASAAEIGHGLRSVDTGYQTDRDLFGNPADEVSATATHVEHTVVGPQR